MKVCVWIVICAAAVLYVAGEEEIRLQELEGNTVTLHTGLMTIQDPTRVLWSYISETAEVKIMEGRVRKGHLVTDYYSDRFRDRLQLYSTGSLTIRNISREDSGVYKLHIIIFFKTFQFFTFSVDVYAPVSKPIIRNQHEHHTGSSREPCFLLCTVENGQDVSLSWYEEKERISSITRADSIDNLSLPLNITDLHYSNYTCVVANPVTNQTTQLSFTELCYSDTVLSSGQYHRSVEFVVRMVLSAVVVLATVFILLHHFTSRTAEMKG